ncbi:MAG: sulfurtransferase FdhD [Hyphobacterium sp.]|nr:MAG: sulfurtransferase FdhD [Hyphobacterium sp.]
MSQSSGVSAAWRSVNIRPTGENWGIAEEVAVEIGFNGTPWTVMMASPVDVENLALGLAFTEGLIDAKTALKSINVRTFPEGLTVDLAVDPDDLNHDAMRQRALDGTTGCGLCGVESLADALRRPTRPETTRPDIGQDAIVQAFDQLAMHQPLNAATRSVHAAAWCAPDGCLRLVREDVGRHNALDKLIGALLRSDAIAEDGFIIMSSRCSFELVAKAGRTNAALLATLSAPTGLALDLAHAVGLPLACRGLDGRINFLGGSDDDGR